MTTYTMKRLYIFISVVYFFSCQKPFNPDPVDGMIVVDSMAIFNLISSVNTCSHVIPTGVFAKGKLLDSLNKIIADVNVTKVGKWQAMTDTINGIVFFSSGKFLSLGKQQIVLQGKGLPAVAGYNNFKIVAGNQCSFVLYVDSSSAGAVNNPPVAYAGADTSVFLPVNSITVLGKGKDVDGFITSFQWRKITGPPSFVITNPTDSITAINNLVEGIYQFQLTVTDNLGATGKDTISIKVIEGIKSGNLFIQQELDAVSPVNDTMNYVYSNIANITSNYHLKRVIDYGNSRIYKIDYWSNDYGNTYKAITHTYLYDAQARVSQIYESQISINTSFLHEEFIYNTDNTLHERKSHFLGGRIFRDIIFLYTGGNLTTCINLTPDNMGAPDTVHIAYDLRENTFNKIAPQYYLLDLQSDYYLTFSSEIFYFSKNYPVSIGISNVTVNVDPVTKNPTEILVNNILLLRYIYK